MALASPLPHPLYPGIQQIGVLIGVFPVRLEQHLAVKTLITVPSKLEFWYSKAIPTVTNFFFLVLNNHGGC